MKHSLLISLYCIISCSSVLFAQSKTNVFFEFSCVPTSTNDYSIEISKDKFVLKRTDMKSDRKGERIIRVDSSHYVHMLNLGEKESMDSIIRLNKLDSVGLYQERNTVWGSLWKVRIERNSITYQIDLPNYSNIGLESLIQFIFCLIPKKERPPFECTKCN